MTMVLLPFVSTTLSLSHEDEFRSVEAVSILHGHYIALKTTSVSAVLAGSGVDSLIAVACCIMECA